MSYNQVSIENLMLEIKNLINLNDLVQAGPGTDTFRGILESMISKNWNSFLIRWYLTQKYTGTIYYQYFSINGFTDYETDNEKEEYSQLAEKLLNYLME